VCQLIGFFRITKRYIIVRLAQGGSKAIQQVHLAGVVNWPVAIIVKGKCRCRLAGEQQKKKSEWSHPLTQHQWSKY
jgi:hypothetical protein